MYEMKFFMIVLVLYTIVLDSSFHPSSLQFVTCNNSLFFMQLSCIKKHLLAV